MNKNVQRREVEVVSVPTAVQNLIGLDFEPLLWLAKVCWATTAQICSPNYPKVCRQWQQDTKKSQNSSAALSRATIEKALL